jgi:CheY-like chemotaxis protein
VHSVLIADDQLGIRKLVSATLLSDEYVLKEAADGDEAWKIMQQEPPTVAILDVNMPGRTGLELTEAMRADAALKHVRIILLTSENEPRDIARGLAAGADVYLTKPFSPLQLLTLVEQALGDAA